MRLDRIVQAAESGEWLEVMLEAEELLDEVPDHAEALKLLGVAMSELGDAEGALPVFEHHLRLTGADDPVSLLGLARSRFETCDLVGAREAARAVLRIDASSAQAHDLLGLAIERLESPSAALPSFMAAQQLDGEAYPFPVHVPPDQWPRILELALGRVGEDVDAFWRGVPVEFHDWPDLERLREPPPISPAVTGLYVGTPDPEQPDARPTGLQLFTRSLARAADLDEVIERLAETLEHEAWEWLGVPPEDLPT